jgi:hypothetical protein
MGFAPARLSEIELEIKNAGQLALTGIWAAARFL